MVRRCRKRGVRDIASEPAVQHARRRIGAKRGSEKSSSSVGLRRVGGHLSAASVSVSATRTLTVSKAFDKSIMHVETDFAPRNVRIRRR
ncbi:hypothetical protein Trydic_g12102 [Trypoxylus dichotomus]